MGKDMGAELRRLKLDPAMESRLQTETDRFDQAKSIRRNGSIPIIAESVLSVTISSTRS